MTKSLINLFYGTYNFILYLLNTYTTGDPTVFGNLPPDPAIAQAVKDAINTGDSGGSRVVPELPVHHYLRNDHIHCSLGHIHCSLRDYNEYGHSSDNSD